MTGTERILRDLSVLSEKERTSLMTKMISEGKKLAKLSDVPYSYIKSKQLKNQ